MKYEHGERWYSFPEYCRRTYGHRLYKVPLDAGMSCPNRDGKIGRGGCIFCDEGGSGDFAIRYTGQTMTKEQLKYGTFPEGPTGLCIGYFQAYTNTYAPIERLRFLFSSALSDPMFAGISIATRPDCMDSSVMNLLDELKHTYSDKFIWVELGLQSMHERSAIWMRRGYPLSVFEKCVRELNQRNIPVIVHVIFGLPNESEEDMLETVRYLNHFEIFGVKLQLLHVLKHTDLCKLYETGELKVLDRNCYIDTIVHAIGWLNPNTVIHRLTGDGANDLLVAPIWSHDKLSILNEIRKQMKEENIEQGCFTEGRVK